MSESPDFGAIDAKWQRIWDERRTFAAANPGQDGSDRPTFFVLDFFPYPSGAGLHVGHPLGYIGSDILARYRRMRGYNVLHPMGWDAFGLPAEQYAVETGVHPAITTKRNIETYKRQLKMIGLSFDWQREIATCNADYYRWTQWIFLQIYNSWYDAEHRWTDNDGRQVVGRARPIAELPIPPHVEQAGSEAVADYRDAHRLAFLHESPVNWCPMLGTVLANEEITADGRSERGDHPVYRRPMKQWMLRITEYADRLLADLDSLDWPDSIKLQQRDWIGRSVGAYVDFALSDHADHVIRVFTTRPDTLYGATYVVLAPEHRLVPVVTTPAQMAEVEKYVALARQKSDRARTADSKVKTGVFTGSYAINPVSGERVPIWIADYVLATYGTGSIMAVPGSDRRDLEFAETFDIPVRQVVAPPGDEPWRGFEGVGTAVNSPPAGLTRRGGPLCELNGLSTPEAKKAMIEWLEAHDLGDGTVQYRLRDWQFARQRYWGEPFPIFYEESGRAHAVPESELPVELPEMEDFRPVASDNPDAEPQTPLSRASHWVHFEKGGRRYRREANTMPQWAGSCWYYLRFLDPHNDRAFCDPAVERYWMGGTKSDGTLKMGGVDLYVGGAEHAVLHLLYARFWHKVLYDLGHVSTPEPFQRLFNQGMIGAAAFRDERGIYVDAGAVVDAQGRRLIDVPDAPPPYSYEGRAVQREMGKMGKSLKNAVNPDDIVREYGADTLRLYEMYMGPLEAGKPWNTRDIKGPHEFLRRVWRLLVSPEGGLNSRVTDQPNPTLERLLHKTVKKVTSDVEDLSYNTAIAKLIEFVNEAYRQPAIGRDQAERLVLLLSPLAPHVCEELWERLGRRDALARAPWPTFDEAMTVDATVEIAVQINGVVRGRVHVPADTDDAGHIEAAHGVEAVARHLDGKPIKRAVVVKKKIVNFIV